MSNYLSNYVGRIKDNGNTSLAEAIHENATKISNKYIKPFSFYEHVRSLLVGEVQSGKTCHMFGIMCAAADNSFGVFLLLTTDNTILQKQTFDRATKDLPDFCICDENDYVKFNANRFKKPIVVVLKKNSKVLRKWKNYLLKDDYHFGNPLFIVDDEADAASLNTFANKKTDKRSSINQILYDLVNGFNSSIYLEVTGTPQALLLQSLASEWKPLFINYFKPGPTYIGGDYFFASSPNPYVVFTDDDEAQDLIEDDEFPENGLKKALIVYLLSTADLIQSGEDTCNFLIHPSVQVNQHQIFGEKVGQYLNEINSNIDSEPTIQTFKDTYNKLMSTKTNIGEFSVLYDIIRMLLMENRISILTLNSKSNFIENSTYDKGFNIIVGGNSLGRGVTFPKLQTIYYCRVAKKPQSDTMWQHARMFGYDRDPKLIRVFMPPRLFELFAEINATNRCIINQILKQDDSTISFKYKKGIRPTRKNVIDAEASKVYVGNTNYFPFYPTNINPELVDKYLENFPDGEYNVSLKIIIKILENIKDEEEAWSNDVFISFLNAILAENELSQGKLIVRRNRDIKKGTGTLLSQNDRALGDNYTDIVVLTMYKVTGTKGWNNQQIWIPNIKLPGKDVLYYIGEQE